MAAEPGIALADLVAAREDVAIIEKTSSSNVRKNTRSAINNVIIGQVSVCILLYSIYWLFELCCFYYQMVSRYIFNSATKIYTILNFGNFSMALLVWDKLHSLPASNFYEETLKSRMPYKINNFQEIHEGQDWRLWVPCNWT